MLMVKTHPNSGLPLVMMKLTTLNIHKQTKNYRMHLVEDSLDQKMDLTALSMGILVNLGILIL